MSASQGRKPPVELRVRAGRAVLAAERSNAGGRRAEVDPSNLPLGADLADALQEWAQVAGAVERAVASGSAGTASTLISRRGRQLAGRLAAVIGAPVQYADPVTGRMQLVNIPERAPLTPPAAPRRHRLPPGEPTPWGTGLTVSAVTATVVVIAMLTLSLGLVGTSPWLALAANVVVAGGLAPSLWLARSVLVWRWVVYGVAGGIMLAWIGLLLHLL